MINMPGKDQYSCRFNWYEWSAPIYITPQKAIDEMIRHGILGKQIQNIRIIGHASFESGFTDSPIHMGLSVERNEDLFEKYPFLINRPVPAMLRVLEPIIFEFVDGSSMEILSDGKERLRLSFDSIPKTITDGINHLNIDAGLFFQHFWKGQSIRQIKFEKHECNKYHLLRSIEDDESHSYEDNDDSYIWKFSLGGSKEIWLEAPDKLYAKDGLIDYVDRSVLIQSIIPQRQIVFGDGEFWIFPCSSDQEKGNSTEWESIGLLEETFGAFLYDYLVKYYKPSVQLRQKYSTIHNEFYWYGRNVFTVQDFKLFLSDLRQVSEKLKQNPEEPSLVNLREGLTRCFVPDVKTDGYIHATRFQANEWQVIVDFYDRFCKEAEQMIKMNPEYDRIVVLGP